MTPHEFAKKYLFAPLNIRESKWLFNYKKINHGWGDLFLYPADMTKIGKLMLDKGQWNNKEVLSRAWVEKCLRTYSRLDEEKGYGYGWWTYDKGGYYEAAGRGRQTISIIPSKNMIVIMLGGEFDAGTIGKYIFQSIQNENSLPENKTALAELTRSIRQAARIPLLKETTAISDGLLNTLNGKTIVFEKNLSGMDSLLFNFLSKSSGAVIFYRNKTKEQYPFVVSKSEYALGMDPELQLPVALQVESRASNQFVLHYNQLCRINNFYFEFVINKNNIATTLEETSNFVKIKIASQLR